VGTHTHRVGIQSGLHSLAGAWERGAVRDFYNDYASIFLALVAIPSILGEMSFAVWLLKKRKGIVFKCKTLKPYQ